MGDQRIFCVSIAAAIAACGGNGGGSGTTALFALPGGPAGDDFYALPYPNDLFRTADGTLDLSTFPTKAALVDQYRVAAQSLDGFGLNSALYARFDGALDPTSLPSVTDSTGADASVYLLDLADGSRTPLIVDFRADPGGTIGPDHLVARPYPGFGLTEGTQYALVITDRVRAANGDPVVASDEFMTLRAGGASLGSAKAVYAPLWPALGAAETAHVVSATVFTTQHTSFIAQGLRAGVNAADAPVATDVVLSPTTDTPYRLYTGAYMAPNFQSGDVPYLSSGGEIAVDANGVAIVQRTETMRFALTVPTGTMPVTGWPIAIYQHGTGGDYESFVDDGTGGRLAAQGIAVISTDQVLAGPRNPNGDAEFDFFNFSNPFAARDNALQGVADAFAQLRLARGLSFMDNGAPIAIDPTKVMFFGHSQGGATGPGFVALEPSLTGAVLSGTGGVLYLALLYKTQPLDIPGIVDGAIRDNPVDEDNPTLALVQMWLERADVANFAPLFVRRPATVDGVVNKPRNIYQSEGFTDTYATNPAIEAMATAIGGDLVATAAEAPVMGLTLRDSAVVTPPVAANRGRATAVLAQYNQAPGSDGHFVVFEVPAAETQSAQFLGTLAATGTATVVPAQ